MIKMPLDMIISRVKEATGVSEEELNKKIESKLVELSGLISKEGAAHIIANELGVKLFEQVTGKLQIKNILPGMRDVEVIGKVQQVSPITEFQRKDGSAGKVSNLLIADETGQIRIVLWGSHADNAKSLSEGATVKIISGYVRENNARVEVHLNDRSKIEINPEGESLGEIKLAGPKRKKIAELNDLDDNVELLGTIVQVFEPRFFEVCPNCGKRVRLRENGFFCEEHNEVSPSYSYVLNSILDDGTETIRAVFFRRQAEHLLEMPQEEILKYKDAPELFEEIKTKLLGNIIKVSGRAKKNEMFDRIEFVTSLVNPKPDPKEEIEKLKSEPQQKKPEEASNSDTQKDALPSVEEI